MGAVNESSIIFKLTNTPAAFKYDKTSFKEEAFTDLLISSMLGRIDSHSKYSLEIHNTQTQILK